MRPILKKKMCCPHLLLLFLLITTNLIAQEKVNIQIITDPPGAHIYLDNKEVGTTGEDGFKTIIAVSIGSHKIRIEKDQYNTHDGTIEVIDDINKTQTTFKFPLTQNKIIPPTKYPPIPINHSTSSIPPVMFPVILILLILAILSIVLFRMVQSSKHIGIIGKFKLFYIIGKGGIATIYKAKDLQSHKIIALKVMDRELVKDADLVYKFFREGEAITRINKEFPEAPVVRVLDYGRDRERFHGIPYIAMELIRGRNLLNILKQKGQVPLLRKLYITKQIAMALCAAHKLNIFHGDITPDNVLVHGDNVTLIDFGIAFQEYDTIKIMDLTITGKPVYMSPEQCVGELVTNKSDVYSLGIILFFMCCGIPPFIASNPSEIITMHQETPLPEISGAIPEELKGFLKQMLAKEPESRPDAAEVVQFMDSLIKKMIPIKTPQKPNIPLKQAFEKINKSMNRWRFQLYHLKKIAHDQWRRNFK